MPSTLVAWARWGSFLQAGYPTMAARWMTASMPSRAFGPRRIGDVALDQLEEAVLAAGQEAVAAELEDVLDADRVPLFQEDRDQSRADIAGPAGDQDSHDAPRCINRTKTNRIWSFSRIVRWLSIGFGLQLGGGLGLGRDGGGGRRSRFPAREFLLHLEDADELLQADPEQARDEVDGRAADLPRAVMDRHLLNTVPRVVGRTTNSAVNVDRWRICGMISSSTERRISRNPVSMSR